MGKQIANFTQPGKVILVQPCTYLVEDQAKSQFHSLLRFRFPEGGAGCMAEEAAAAVMWCA